MTLTCAPTKSGAPPGLDGGPAGTPGHVFVNGRELHRFPAMEFLPGDELRLLLPGGGGFGPAAEREPELIRHDLEMGYISAAAAEHDYGFPSDRSHEA